MRFITFFILISLSSNFLFGQQIRVEVLDAKNKKPISNVTAITAQNKTIAQSNEHGILMMSVNHQNEKIYLTHWDYTTSVIQQLKDCTIFLEPKIDTLSEINISEKVLGEEKAIKLTKEEIVTLSPSFLSSFNLEKNLQVLPGVTITSDIQSGLYVRGSHRGESRVMFNHIPQFSSNHLFGLASNYQEELLEKVTFHKGYFPSSMYNGITSFLNVDVDSKIPQKTEAKLSLGTLSSELYTKVRINETTKVDVGYRRTYLDAVAHLYHNIQDEYVIPIYNFNDFSINFLKKVNENDKVNVTYISSYDKIQSKINSNNIDSEWSGKTLSANYLKLTDIGVFEFYTGGNWNNFHFLHSYEEEHDSLSANNKLNSYVIGTKFFKELTPKLKLESTVEYQQNKGVVDNLWVIESSENKHYRNDIPFIHQKNFSTHLFYQLNTIFSIDGGININHYTRDTYNDWQLAPKVSFNFSFDKQLVNISYNRSQQNIHYLPYIGFDMPIDMWNWTNENISPLTSDNYQLDYMVKILPQLQLNLGTFYSVKQNVVDFKDGADYLYNEWDNEQITQGREEIIGGEVELNSDFFKIPLKVSYTYLQSERRNKDISQGEPYQNSYSPRHQLAISVHKQLNKRFSFNCNWYYSSGQRITIPESFIFVTTSNHHKVVVVPVYEKRNNFELPANHRMDISATYMMPIRSNQMFFTLNIFNVYNNKNAYFVSFEKVKREEEPSLIKGRKKALIPFLPSFKITYQL